MFFFIVNPKCIIYTDLICFDIIRNNNTCSIEKKCCYLYSITDVKFIFIIKHSFFAKKYFKKLYTVNIMHYTVKYIILKFIIKNVVNFATGIKTRLTGILWLAKRNVSDEGPL